MFLFFTFVIMFVMEVNMPKKRCPVLTLLFPLFSLFVQYLQVRKKLVNKGEDGSYLHEGLEHLLWMRSVGSDVVPLHRRMNERRESLVFTHRSTLISKKKKKGKERLWNHCENSCERNYRLVIVKEGWWGQTRDADGISCPLSSPILWIRNWLQILVHSDYYRVLLLFYL